MLTFIENGLLCSVCLCLCQCAQQLEFEDVSNGELRIVKLIPNPKDAMYYTALPYLCDSNSLSEEDSGILNRIDRRIPKIPRSAIMTMGYKTLKAAMKDGYKPCITYPINKVEKTEAFEFVLSDKGFTADQWEDLMGIYQALDDSSESLSTKTAVFSLLNDVLRITFKDKHPRVGITSPGAKEQMCRMIDISYFEENLIKAICEPFCRTSIFSLTFAEYVERIYLNDIDERVVAFLRCIKEAPYYLLSAILDELKSEEYHSWKKAKKRARVKSAFYKEEGIKKNVICEESEAYKEYLNSPKLRPFEANGKINTRVIKCAARFFVLINSSYRGREDLCGNYITTNGLVSLFAEMLSASIKLQKSVITCMDFAVCLDLHKGEEGLFSFCDSPYVTTEGKNDKTYKNKEFTIVSLGDMCAICRGIEHCIITHYDVPIANDVFQIIGKKSLIKRYRFGNERKTTYVWGSVVSARIFKGNNIGGGRNA